MSITAPGHWRNMPLIAQRWKSVGIDPADECVACGHMALQHGGEKDLNNFKTTTSCDWRTCGCPCFVTNAPKEGADDGNGS